MELYVTKFQLMVILLLTNNLRSLWQVGDFGLSRIKRNTLVSGGVRGTLPWMAPELLNGSSTRVSEKVILHVVISCFCAIRIKPFTWNRLMFFRLALQCGRFWLERSLTQIYTVEQLLVIPWVFYSQSQLANFVMVLFICIRCPPNNTLSMLHVEETILKLFFFTGGIVNNSLRPTIPDHCDPEWRKLMEECWSADPALRPSFSEITSRLRTMSMTLHSKRTI